MATIVDKGLEMLGKLACGLSTTPFDAIALGTGVTAEANAQTALVTETHRCTGAQSTITYEGSNTVKWAYTFPFSGSFAINEIGIFDDDTASTGNMLMRHVLPATKNVDNGETMAVTITMTSNRV